MKKILLLLLSLIAIVVVFSFVDLSEFNESLASFSMSTIFVVLCLFLFNAFIVIFRYWRMLGHFGYSVGFNDVVRASVSGNIASLLMVPLLGQVAGRHVMLNKVGITAAENAAIAAYERFVVGTLSGVLAVLGGFFIFSSTMDEYIKNIPLVEIFSISIISLLTYFAFFIGPRERMMLNKVFSLKAFRNILEIYLITFFSSAVVLSSFYLLFSDVLPAADVLTILSAAAIVSFLAGLPVSFGGWGLREVSSIYIVSFLGGTTAAALAASVLLGLISTAAVLLLFPFLFIRSRLTDFRFDRQLTNELDSANVESIAVWILTLLVGLLVFFQLHVQIGTGHLNINLADPFAMLVFSVVMLNVILRREMPRWSVPRFNVYLLVISFAYLYSYVVGLVSFGNTGWAVGKLIGWLVLLGYLFSGYLVVRYFRRLGFFKLYQLMLVTIVMILAVNIVMWMLFINGVVKFDNFHYILEAYSGNRNALAFQVLVVFCLALAFQPWYERLAGSSGANFVAISLSVMIAAVLITASRSAIGAMFVVLAVALLLKVARRAFIAKSTACGILLFIVAQYGFYFVNSVLSGYSGYSVVLPISSESSDLARWKLVVESFGMWRDNPFFGAGLGAFVHNSVDVMGFSVVVHNTGLWLLAEFGLFGFLMFFIPFVFILKYSIFDCDSRVISNALILLIIMFALMSLFHEVFYQRMFWLVLGGLIAVQGCRRVKYNVLQFKLDSALGK